MSGEIGIQSCTSCDDPATDACPRCEQPVCGFHRPWKAGLACRVCEDQWERGATLRKLILWPVALAALVVAAGLLFGVLLLVEQRGFAPAGLGAFVAIFGVPIVFALGAVRLVERKVLRPRFFANRPPARVPPMRAAPPRG